VSTSSHPVRTIAVLAYAVLSFALGQTLLVPALPKLITSLHTNEADISWTLTAFFVSSAIAGPILGRLGDMFGKRRLAMTSTGLYGIGALVSASTSNLWVVVFGRTIQGVGATVVVLAYSLARDLLPEAIRARGIGLITGISSGGGAIGIIVGGLVAQHVGWQWLFWVSAIVAATATAGLLLVPESPVKSGGRVDLRGAAVLTVGVGLPLFGISRAARWGWGDPRVIGLIVAGLIVLAFWVKLEERTPQPLANIALLRSRPVLLINLCGLFVGYIIIVGYVLVPQLGQAPTSTGYGFGVDAVGGGLLILPGSLALMAAGPLAGSVGTRMGVRAAMALSGVVSAAGYILLAYEHGTKPQVLIFTAVAIMGGGFALTVSVNFLIDVTPPALTGEAAGFNNVLFRTGMALGAQISGTLLASSTVHATGLPGDSGYTTSFLLAGVVGLATIGAAFLLPARRRHRAAPAAPAADPLAADPGGRA
jgi:MFS family permease